MKLKIVVFSLALCLSAYATFADCGGSTCPVPGPVPCCVTTNGTTYYGKIPPN